jgi:DNA-binding transcriptional regulator YiaG
MTKAKPKSQWAKMGRPTLGDDARTIPVMVRLSANEKRAFTKAAKAAGMGLGPWLLELRRRESEGDRPLRPVRVAKGPEQWAAEGERIKARRIACGLSQSYLAASSGIANETLCRIENGKRRATEGALQRLYSVLEIAEKRAKK